MQSGTIHASLVMTAHNAARYIRSSLRAALAQDYGSFEVVVFDDGSDDETGKVCLSINDPRLRYIRSERIGRSRALNAAIAQAHGRYIAINDADDLSFPFRLSYAIQFMDIHSDISVIGTNFINTPHNVFIDQVPQAPPEAPASDNRGVVWVTPLRLYRSNTLNHSTLVFRKKAWEQVNGYDERLEMCIDYDFYLRMSKLGSIAILATPTVLHFLNSTSIFKKKSAWNYLRTSQYIRRRARGLLNLPSWVRIFDLLTYVTVCRSVVDKKNIWREIAGGFTGKSRAA